MQPGSSHRPLISAEELSAALSSGEPRSLLDVRWELGGRPGREQFAEGHIPGAVYVDLETELAGPAGPEGRHPLPGAEAFAAGMRAAGVCSDRAVIVYDSGSLSAARAWWLLRYHGHSRVAVLDGGIGAWIEAGQPLQREASAVAPGNFLAQPGGMAVLSASQAAALAGRGVLLDARAPERFHGESEPIDPVAGHIPGAINRPASRDVGGDGRIRPAAELRQELETLGIGPETALGSYCGSGVSAAHQVLALQLAGFSAALYPGSWSEWIVDPHRPVART